MGYGGIIGQQPDLSNTLTKDEASGLYLTKTEANNLYLNKSDSANFYKKSEIAVPRCLLYHYENLNGELKPIWWPAGEPRFIPYKIIFCFNSLYIPSSGATSQLRCILDDSNGKYLQLGTITTNMIVIVSYPITVWTSSMPSGILQYSKIVSRGAPDYVDDVGYNLNDTMISPKSNHYFINTTNNFIGYSVDVYWYY